MLYGLPGTAAKRILLVCLGRAEDFGERAYRQAMGSAGTLLAETVANDAVVTLADIDLPGRPATWLVQQASQILACSAYRFHLPGSRTLAANGPRRGARDVLLLIQETLTTALTSAHRLGLAVAEGIALTKDIGNMPGNICTPEFLASTAQELGKQFGFQVDVLEREDMEKLGMGALVAVGSTSHAPSKLIVMHYRAGRSKAKPIVLIGQGLTHGSRNSTHKAGGSGDEPSFEVAGAGSVLGAMKTVARIGLALNVVGIVAAAEASQHASSVRPGDVFTSMSGQTIEVRTADDEGRLLLCDALTYAARFDPACVIDVATLTGACAVALGPHASGLFANDDALAADLLKSGHESDDRSWRLPLWDDYLDQNASTFADTSSLGGVSAGAITAACFLGRFAKSYKWAHLDIAGTASASGSRRGPTGRPVPLLTDFLVKRAAEA
jgi:leucyl aminopeptidase